MAKLTTMDKPSITRPLVATQRTTLTSGRKLLTICGAMEMTRLSTLRLERIAGKLSPKAERCTTKDLWHSDTSTVTIDTTRRTMKTTLTRLSYLTELPTHVSGLPRSLTPGLSPWTSVITARPGLMESLPMVSREPRIAVHISRRSHCLKACTSDTCHIPITMLLLSTRTVVSGFWKIIGISRMKLLKQMRKRVSIYTLKTIEGMI
jgi:hypothetical protein